MLVIAHLQEEQVDDMRFPEDNYTFLNDEEGATGSATKGEPIFEHGDVVVITRGGFFRGND